MKTETALLLLAGSYVIGKPLLNTLQTANNAAKTSQTIFDKTKAGLTYSWDIIDLTGQQIKNTPDWLVSRATGQGVQYDKPPTDIEKQVLDWIQKYNASFSSGGGAR